MVGGLDLQGHPDGYSVINFLKVHSLNMEWEQERLYLKEGSRLQPLRQGIILTAKIKQCRERKTGMYLHLLNSIKNWRLN